jgi:hypothetical protein
MLRVMYIKARHAIIFARQCSHLQETRFDDHENNVNHMAASDTTSQPNWRLMGDSGAAPETVFPPPSAKHQLMEFLFEELCCHPSNRVPDTCRISVKVHWSCSGSLVDQCPVNTLYVGVSFILSVSPVVMHPYSTHIPAEGSHWSTTVTKRCKKDTSCIRNSEHRPCYPLASTYWFTSAR